MPGLDAMPNTPAPEGASRYNTWLGFAFFVLYLAFYAAFVVINAFWPDTLDTVAPGGVNLGILYGLGLILSAFGLAVVYSSLCRKPDNPEKPS